MDGSIPSEAVVVQPAQLLPIKARKCKSVTHDESPCKNWAIFGGDLCWMHGGATPHSLEAARERLTALVGPAIGVMYQIMHSTDVCPQCGRGGDESLMLKAATTVLDRAGLGPKIKVEVQSEDLNGMSLPELRAYHAEIGELLRQLEEAEGGQS